MSTSVNKKKPAPTPRKSRPTGPVEPCGNVDELIAPILNVEWEPTNVCGVVALST